MSRFDDARHLLLKSRPADPFQKLHQRFQARLGVGHPLRGEVASVSIDDDHIVMGVAPIQSGIPHQGQTPFSRSTRKALELMGPYTSVLAVRSSIAIPL